MRKKIEPKIIDENVLERAAYILGDFSVAKNVLVELKVRRDAGENVCAFSIGRGTIFVGPVP